MSKIKGQKGLSLVEVTIMLLVLMLLTSVLAPSMFDFVNDAKWVKVKEDCEAIGISVARLTRDVGPCLKLNAANGCTFANRAEVLTSFSGDDGTLTPLAPDVTLPDIQAYVTSRNWNGVTAAANTDTLESQLVENGPAYQTPTGRYAATGVYPVGPQFNLGWRGAYLAPPVGPDPWGTKYYVNSAFLSSVMDPSISGPDSREGSRTKWFDRDTVCMSAGPNKLIETNFVGSANGGTLRGGDDFVFVISGSSR